LKWRLLRDSKKKAKTVEGLQQLPMRAVAMALEIIPRTLAQNCGADVVRVITELRAKHATPEGKYFGIDGNLGKVADMRESHVWEPVAVKLQTFKTAIESSCMLLRIDDVVSGIKKKREKAPGKTEQEGEKHEGETFGDQRDG